MQYKLIVLKEGTNVTSEEIVKRLYIRDDNSVDLDPGYILEENNRYFQPLCDFKEKICFILLNHIELMGELEEMLKRHCPQITSIEWSYRFDKYDKENKCFVDYDEEYVPALDNECEILEQLKIADASIEDFIFNSKYMIVVNDDPYSTWKTMKKYELIDTTKIEKEIL